MQQSLGHKVFYEHIWSLWFICYLFLFCFSLSSTLLTTRHICGSNSPNTHLCSNDFSLKWTSVAIMRLCLLRNHPPKERAPEGYPHTLDPTPMLSYVYISQSLRLIQFSPEPIRAGVPNSHRGRRRTNERYARGPCNWLHCTASQVSETD